MNKTTIITSAVTCLLVNFLIWLLGWMIWPIVWLGLWIGAGHLSWLMEKNFSSWRVYEDILKRDRYMHYLGGVVWMTFNLLGYGGEILSKYKLPSIRNPFIWPEKHD